MAGAIDIPKGERGMVRLFALDMPPEQARFLREPGALAQLLGTEAVDLDHVEIFPVGDLDEIGLQGYLAEGLGVPAAETARDKAKLDALEGHVLLIRSRAFGGDQTRLTPASQLRLIGTYSERQTDWASSGRIASESATPGSAPRPSPRQARSRARGIGAALFAVVMLLILAAVLALIF